MADDSERPIIIKKIKKSGGGHHGGAWKVAYADFVTAMMAFFLLLWLLATSSKATLEGISEYFTPTIGIKDSMGIGFDGGLTAQSEGNRKSDQSAPGIVTGQTPTGIAVGAPTKTTQVQSDKDAQLFEKAEEAIKKAFESDPTLRELSDNIIVEQTPEGLKIELRDSDKHPLFKAGQKDLTKNGQLLLAAMRKLIARLPNFISITGHTDASGHAKQTSSYTNWELSADRANAARRFLLKSGMQPRRVRKIVGMGSSELLDPEDPRNPRNRRISVILLRGTHLALPNDAMSIKRDFLSSPKATSLE
jgi:chemotaxis protein MotB